MSYTAGSLVTARGREWVVQPGSGEAFLVARPLNGDTDFDACLFADEVTDATFPPPTPGEVGDNTAASLLRTALRIGFTSGAGPFRSLASIAVEPRQYQLVPLLLALRRPTVRLLIGDDVGIGKTVESGLIAKELLERGDASGLTVLCSPALAEQWQAELRDKFVIEATLVLPSTATRLERELRLDESIFDRHPVTVVSLDFIKSDRRYQQFVRTCPDLVIVDEAHTCVAAGSSSKQSQLRYRLLQELAAERARHLLLVTATPHSGKEDAFRDLIGLLDPELATLNLEGVKGRERLAQHFVQRRRRDIRRYLDQETPFPQDRQIRDVSYMLTGEYGKLARQVLAYARETVRQPGTGLRQRVSWWSALALLRSVASSPRAAAATLDTRSATVAADTEAEADELGRSSVLDLTDEEALEGIDAAAGGRTGEEVERAAGGERLRRLARAFRTIEGPKDDSKLAALITEVKALLADGYDPIVFCRFIPTAEYVAEHLAKVLGKKAHVRHVTGQLPPEARQEAIHDLAAEPGRHVLVATDCLSEGVNLQENFQAVIHYDLAWNPTRHEQREGRVDRFGQRSQIVRAVTLYGKDNGIDGVVLDVLIRKHRTIARQTGVAVPVPTGGDDVIKALVEGLLLRSDDDTQDQLPLDFGVTKTRDQMHRAWESAADRESKALTKYSHSGVRLEKVQQEVAEIRAALGSSADVSSFTREALSGFGAIIDAHPDGFRADTRQLPVSVRHALGLSFDGTAERLSFHPDIPAPAGSHALVRVDPMVRSLARTVLDSALDGTGPARRCGVIRTEAVSSRTVLLLVRYRFHVTLPGRTATRTLVAEDAQIVGYRTGATGREWLSDAEVGDVLAAKPENTLPELVRRAAERAIAEIVSETKDEQTGEIRREPAAQLTAELDDRGDALAARLAESHQRVRGAVGAATRGLKVTPNRPADVLGVYVYLPAGGAR